jgi:hypothetical protein
VKKEQASCLFLRKEILSMTRLRRWSALSVLLAGALLLFSSVRADEPPAQKKADAKPIPDWMIDRTMMVSAAPAPVPALKYRLYPATTDRRPGNAIPIYLRFAHERSDARKKQIREKPEQWNKLPLDKLPLDEAKKFLDSYRYNLKQLELGARRSSVDWSYTLDAGDPIGLLLPDVQEMRMHAPILVLKARVEMAEGRFADAVRTLETGYSFSQQVGDGPFLINSLVGIACGSMCTDCLTDLIEQPQAPNMYWALAVIPWPLNDLRKANEIEQRMLEMQFPDLADLDRPRSAKEWDRVLANVRKEIERINHLEKDFKVVKPGCAWTDPASKSPDLPIARKYLTEAVGIKADAIAAMPPAEVLLRYLSSFYHELRDEVFKAAYLPFPKRLAVCDEADKRLNVVRHPHVGKTYELRPVDEADKNSKAAPDTEPARLARLLLPAIRKVQLADIRLPRRLAILQAIEALRMHAAAHNGQLPDKLADVKVVPVPDDPGTGKAFEYQRDGKTATLISRIPGEVPGYTAMRYRVTVRK